MDINKRIKRVLNDIEVEYDVRILYACEAGSRAWGFESEDSDYDVRFIYAHDWRWYMQLQEGRDVIEKPGEMLDISGWDVRKALRLFKKSNPPLLEWIHSSLVYRNSDFWIINLLNLEELYYNPKAASYHYFHMARGNYRDYLQGEGDVWIKKYLYVLRPLLAVKYIEVFQIRPPVYFKELIYQLAIHGTLRDAIFDLLERKKSGSELGFGPRIPVISDFISEEIGRMEQERFSGKAISKGWEPLNDLFIRTIFNVVDYPTNNMAIVIP